MATITYNTNGGNAVFPKETPVQSISLPAGTLEEQIYAVLVAAAANNNVPLDGPITGLGIGGDRWASKGLAAFTEGQAGTIDVTPAAPPAP